MRDRLAGLAVVATMLLGLLAGGSPAEAAPGPGSVQGDVPRSGIALGILTESLTLPEVVTALATRGCAAVVIGIPQGGGFNLYLSGAPSFVNVGFPATMASGQAFVYRCSGETPTVPVATATASPTAPLAPASAALPARDCMPGTTVRRVGTGALARFGTLPTSGTLRGRVIFIDYADAPGTTTDVAGARDNAARVSSAISTQSTGRLGIQFEFAASWIRMPQPKAYYWASGSTDEHPDFVAAVSPSVAAATEDFVVLFDAGNPRSGVSYAGLFEFDSRSRSAKPRVVTSSAQASVWLHETLHLLGLPDLYNEEASTAQQSARLAWMGSWDTMSLASANAIAAWQRWELGWLPDSGVRCLTEDSTDLDLTFATPGGGGTQLAVVRTGLQTALAVELRQSGVVPACTEGVLAYRVDASKSSTDGPLRLLVGGLTSAAVFPAPCTSSYRTATDSYRWDAPLDLAPGRGASVTDSESGVRVEVVSKAGGAWRVRVTQPAGTARPPYTTGRLTLQVTGSSRIPAPYEGLEWVRYDVRMTSDKYLLSQVSLMRSDTFSLRGSYGIPPGALASRSSADTFQVWLPVKKPTGQYPVRISMPDGGFADISIDHVAR